MTRFFSIASALAPAAASLLLLALPSAGAAADTSAAPGRPARPDPVDAHADVPPVAYRSAFSGYQPLADGKVGWKEANDEVGRIGGWRTYAREANAPEPSSSAPGPNPPQGAAGKPEPAAPSKHGGHESHDSHGGTEGHGAPAHPSKN